jgi:microcystin-dependent protein
MNFILPEYTDPVEFINALNSIKNQINANFLTVNRKFGEGVVYFTTDNKTPNDIFQNNSSWEKVGEGFALCSQSDSDSDFQANVQKGSKTAPTNNPAHSHNISGTSTTNGSHSHKGEWKEWLTRKSGSYDIYDILHATTTGHPSSTNAWSHTHQVSGDVANSGTNENMHENMQPYVAINMWIRTDTPQDLDFTPRIPIDSDIPDYIQALKDFCDDFNTQVGDMADKYPVGGIYITTNSDNPNTILGSDFKWERFSEGRVLLSAGNTYLNNSTGGLKNVPVKWLTHSHTVSTNLPATSGSSHHHDTYYRKVKANRGTGYSNESIADSGDFTEFWENGTHSHNISGTSTAVGQSTPTNHNNLQPYITVGIWRRTL